VFSYLLNKPVIGIAYAPKTKDLMAQMGHADYALDIFNCDLAALQERFVSLEVRTMEVKEDIARAIGVHQIALEAQYDRIFEMLEAK
jgi:polysaccharide pyruvyl transferase WcaK-like protein